MPKQNLTEIVAVIDKSGSMHAVKSDAIGGFNSFLEEQQKIPGEARLTAVLFDTHYEFYCKSSPIKGVQPLTEHTYTPSGGTALVDALCRAIDEVGQDLAARSEKKRPMKVIVAILTDGAENSSVEYTMEQCNEKITHQQDVYSWEFIFLAANQDAFTAGTQLGVRGANCFNYTSNSMGTRDAYANLSAKVSAMRTNQGGSNEQP
jgi:uncharacterized protein YegL